MPDGFLLHSGRRLCMGIMGLFLGKHMVWRRGVGALPQAAVLGNRWWRSTSLHHIVCGLHLQIASSERSCAWHTAGQYIFRHIYYQSKRKAFSNLFSNHSPVLNAPHRTSPSFSFFFLLSSFCTHLKAAAESLTTEPVRGI